MTKCIYSLTDQAIQLLFSKELADAYRASPKCFTRRRLMGFAEIMGVILNLSKKSLQLEVDGFMELLDPSMEKPMTKQAFSKARLNILPGAFMKLFETNVHAMFKDDFFKRFKGWRVFAIDGTELQLPKHGNNLPEFRHNSAHSLPHARASILCDALSGFIAHAAIDTTAVGERELAIEHLEYFLHFKTANDLIVFDRGYPSKEFIGYLNANGVKYLMRVPKGFSSVADASAQRDFTVDVLGTDVRAVRVDLPSGEAELLFTNLGTDEFKTDEFLSLCHFRWGVEGKYNLLKNKLDIESFSGRSLHTVLQDFWATMFLANIAAGAKRDADSAIEGEIADGGRKLKYEEYRANENLLIGRLKDNFIMILFEDDGLKRTILMRKLIDRIASHWVPVRPGRSFPRRPDSHKRIANRQRKAL